MYKDMAKLQKICMKTIALLGILMFGYLTFFAWTSSARIYASSEVVVWSEDRIWKNLLFTAGALLVCLGLGELAEKIGDRALQVMAVAVSLAVAAGCAVLAASARSYPTADQIYVYEAAENFFTGDYTNIRTEWYFNACPYQLGLGLLYGLLMRLSGRDGYLILQYAQAACAGVIVYASFALSRELFHCKKAAAMTLLCSVLFAPMYLYTLYLYGETFGVCFAVLCMFFWLQANNGKTRKKSVTALYWILAGLSLALCYTVRLALVIVPIAMLIAGLLKAWADKRANGKRWWLCPALTLLLLFAALGCQKLSVAYMEGQADVELADGIPAVLTVAMGIQDEGANGNGTGPGSYNAYNLWLYFGTGFDGKSASEEALSDIKRTLYRWLHDPAYMIGYMNRKVLNQWNEASCSAFCMTALQQEPEEWVDDLYRGAAGDRQYAFLDLYQGMAYAMLLVYFVLLFRGKGTILAFLPALLLIGEFCFSMIWEAKSRYVYPYIVMALPCVAWTLASCIRMGKESIGRWRK
ncbi:MAG: hypothetical protein NC121_12300 [Blautia sp.]|nr:hypothetical protein [Blautia sp.]